MNLTGKKPATYSSKDLRYADLRPKSLNLSLPHTWGHGMDFNYWGMLGNGPQDDNSVNPSWAAAQGAGNCAWAGPAHEEMQAAFGAKRPIPKFSCLTVLNQYSAYSGYNLQTGANDNGSDVREVLSWRQTKGLSDDNGNLYKVGVYVSLELGNIRELQEASYLFESVGLGIQFPTSAMDQFNSGRMWTVVAGSSIEGGHYVPIVGHPWPGQWTCITWGKRQLVSWNFLAKYADELWAYIDMERYNTVTGETAEHWKDADLEKYIASFGQPQSLKSRIRRIFQR